MSVKKMKKRNGINWSGKSPSFQRRGVTMCVRLSECFLLNNAPEKDYSLLDRPCGVADASHALQLRGLLWDEVEGKGHVFYVI